ncbi:hypothetical protein DFA_07436 [Cavenderia fasciculata]|uniref:Uncharacterized protein n=1 Tax=Cavenderia fasciculata TaxID=261658 RepID=F4PWE9_CACFS|nr:uncharacterized protein DFA_07436 [Cavenderia fasciculata]EGG20313.1 hypothetical protein DFA_07436 [Cavenderia fasciculata]|eukprot:XP_004367296.1 hypothetical protein DFA_07436 [Cavenderia fasciculata]
MLNLNNNIDASQQLQVQQQVQQFQLPEQQQHQPIQNVYTHMIGNPALIGCYPTNNQSGFSLRNNQSTSSLLPLAVSQQQQQKCDIYQQYQMSNSAPESALAPIDFSFSLDLESWSSPSAQSSPWDSSSPSSVASMSPMVAPISMTAPSDYIPVSDNMPLLSASQIDFLAANTQSNTLAADVNVFDPLVVDTNHAAVAAAAAFGQQQQQLQQQILQLQQQLQQQQQMELLPSSPKSPVGSDYSSSPSFSPSSSFSSDGEESDTEIVVPVSPRVIASATKSVPKNVVSPKQQQQKKQPAKPRARVASSASAATDAQSQFINQTLGMNMVLTSIANVAVENGNMNPWKLKLSGSLVRDDGSTIKWQHIVVIASVHSSCSETYNIDNQTANVLDDGTACIKGIKVTKAVRSRSRASQGTANVQRFRLRFVAYDKFSGVCIPIPNCTVESNDITYLANTKNMLPPTINSVERVSADQLPSGFITRDSSTYKFNCNRIKWGKSNNFAVAFQHPETLEIVHYVTETDENCLTPTLTKKESGYLSVPNQYKNFNLVTGFYSQKDRSLNLSTSPFKFVN